MKIVFRMFFRALRLILGPFMLAWEKLSTPKGIVRDPEQQARIDASTRNLALYQFKTCPFCIKTRRTIARLSLNIETRDAQHDQINRRELEQQGGGVVIRAVRKGYSLFVEEDGSPIARLRPTGKFAGGRTLTMGAVARLPWFARRS